MPTIVVPDGYLLERLDTARHSRKEFSSGKEALDTFLRTQASQAQGKYASATHVLIENVDTAGECPIVGYVTLVSSEIPLLEVPPSIKRISNKNRLPALLLAKMGVDAGHKGKRLGECLLKHALVAAWQMNQNSGCLVVIVASVITSKAANSYHFKTGQPDWPSGTENVLPCRLLWWQVGFG
ncbi:MAG: hypothetical protein WA555_00935, partial [Candidatus Sulfotelmatobacter sp.]